MKLLYIKANPKPVSESYTFQISEYFIEEYRRQNPTHVVEVLDLYDETSIDFLKYEDLAELKSGGSKRMLKYANQFKSSSKIVIAAPMWNFSIPAILKAYIDYIVIGGVTFKYSEEGAPVGLMNSDTKLMHITARGGSYSSKPMSDVEMSDRYLRAIFNFIGINNIETIAIENTSDKATIETTLENAKNKAVEYISSGW